LYEKKEVETPKIEPKFTGRVRFGARCNGMNEADTTEWDEVKEVTDEELEDMARDHGITSTGFECWFEKEDE
jgi:hypothetical protein